MPGAVYDFYQLGLVEQDSFTNLNTLGHRQQGIERESSSELSTRLTSSLMNRAAMAHCKMNV